MRMRVSILTPKAFSIRSAISPERLALPFNRLDRVGRETCRTRAAAVTERPRGSMISVRMKSPGWGGLSVRIGRDPPLMIVLKIQVADLSFFNIDPKSETPVAGYI